MKPNFFLSPNISSLNSVQSACSLSECIMGLTQNVEALATKITVEIIKASCISLTILFQNRHLQIF
jgi:hypothetical protein